MGMDVLSADASHRVAIIGGRVITGMFRGTPLLAGVEAYARHGTELAARHPRAVAFLTIALEPGRPPDAPTRDVFARMMRENSGRSAADAILTMGGSALGMSVVRGVVTGLLMVARNATPTRIFGDVREAAAWMDDQARQAGVTLASPSEVHGHVEQLARDLRAGAPAR